jgi:hypothetical protein
MLIAQGYRSLATLASGLCSASPLLLHPTHRKPYYFLGVRHFSKTNILALPQSISRAPLQFIRWRDPRIRIINFFVFPKRSLPNNNFDPVSQNPMEPHLCMFRESNACDTYAGVTGMIGRCVFVCGIWTKCYIFFGRDRRICVFNVYAPTYTPYLHMLHTWPGSP